MPILVLASTSPYRRSLLARLGLPFETATPRTDETPLPDEAPESLVTRLAEAKARAIAADYPGALIVGSDQVAVLDGSILGKPGHHAGAVAQLSAARGRQVQFLTGLCLLDTRNNRSRCCAVPFDVVFRQLTDEQIEHYLRHEQPYDCAGSFKSEGLGIALFERLEGDDPNALMGLPLIALTKMLASAGIDALTHHR
jgi:septum formation protein